MLQRNPKAGNSYARAYFSTMDPLKPHKGLLQVSLRTCLAPALCILLIGGCSQRTHFQNTDDNVDESEGDAGETFQSGDDRSDSPNESGKSELPGIDDEDEESWWEEPYEPYTKKIDLLIVVDNSVSTIEEQENLARSFSHMVREFERNDESGSEFGGPDVQLMVTTTDMGNPLCSGPGSAAAHGSPVTTSCIERLDQFSTLRDGEVVTAEDVCTTFCADGIELEQGFEFLAFTQFGRLHNIKTELAPRDIDGDGIEENAVEQAIACILPQGISGCEYGSPLEAMMQALDPSASWNKGEHPYLRDDAVLAIMIVSDKADCSLQNPSLMLDEGAQRINPRTGEPEPSHSICWDAGTECTPKAEGEEGELECVARADSKLHPTSRYSDYLVENLFKQKRKEVVILGVLGVPEVTKYSEEHVRVPIEGGVYDLEYRSWRDAEFPEGDILPGAWESGVRADDMEWAYGIGPGCAGASLREDGSENITGQATPPLRVLELCKALDAAEAELVPDEYDRRPRCCIESICSKDFSSVFGCLTPRIEWGCGGGPD